MAKKSSTAKEKEKAKKTVAEEEVKDQKEPQAETEQEAETETEGKEEEKQTEEKESIDFKDRYLRLSAEFDNYRKRTLKEKMDLTKTASEEIIKKLLPVVDDFQRGLDHMSEAKDLDAVKHGVQLIFNKMNEILKQQGVKEIEAMEQVFDMEIHEAITKIPAPKEDLKGKVVDVVEKGYYLHEKIIRYPKVVVGE